MLFKEVDEFMFLNMFRLQIAIGSLVLPAKGTIILTYSTNSPHNLEFEYLSGY